MAGASTIDGIAEIEGDDGVGTAGTISVVRASVGRSVAFSVTSSADAVSARGVGGVSWSTSMLFALSSWIVGRETEGVNIAEGMRCFNSTSFDGDRDRDRGREGERGRLGEGGIFLKSMRGRSRFEGNKGTERARSFLGVVGAGENEVRGGLALTVDIGFLLVVADRLRDGERWRVAILGSE